MRELVLERIDSTLLDEGFVLRVLRWGARPMGLTPGPDMDKLD
jgi:hypothetical protein